MANEDQIIKVDINLPPKKMKEFCEAHDNWILMIDENMNAGALKNYIKFMQAVNIAVS